MHRCLHMPEIISEILDYSHGNYYDRTVANAAMSCKTFLKPGLDILWREQLVLAPLIKCMPSDLWTTVLVSPDIGMKLVFLRPLRDSDFDRVLLYSLRIRTLGRGGVTNLGTLSGIDDSVYEALAAYNPPVKFLNLRCLEWFPWNGNLFYHIKDYCRAQNFLREVTIDLDSHMPGVDTMELLASLPQHFPRIQQLSLTSRLELDDSGPTCDCYNILREALSKLHNLRSFSLVGWPICYFQFFHLISIPDLIEVDIHLDEDKEFKGEHCSAVLPPGGTPPGLPTLHRGGFASLQKFTFMTEKLSFCAELLSSMSHCPLSSLAFVLTGKEHPGNDGLERFFNVLSNHPTFRSLSTFMLQIDSPPRDPLQLDPVLSLFQVPKLEFVDIIAGFPLDDAWLQQAVNAWPRLCQLRLDSRGPNGITLAGLVPLALRPNFEYFAGAIDACATDFDLPGGGGGDFDNKVTELGLFGSTISNASEVARCLLTMFPNLDDSVDGYDKDMDNSPNFTHEDFLRYEMWVDVDDFIEAARSGCKGSVVSA